MERNGRLRNARHSPIVAIFALLVVALFALLLAMPAGPLPAARGEGRVHAAIVRPDVVNPNLYINRSQINGGTYVKEWVAFNNTTTLNQLPFSLKPASGCRWVTVLNLTAPSVPASVFHNVQYANVTSGNNSGTLVAGVGTVSYKACSGTPSWVNYIYWTFGAWTFATGTLGNLQTSGTIAAKGLANLTLVWKSPTGYAGAKKTFLNQTFPYDTNHALQLFVATNTSFAVLLPTPVAGATTCDVTGQVCSYPQWTLVSSSSTANVTKNVTLAFAQPTTATWHNWTSGYAQTNISVNSAIGGFFAATQSFFITWFWNLWWVWIVVILVVIVAVAAWRKA